MEHVTVLAGGVGGAKLAHGFALCQPEIHLTVIVNTGDDFDHFGLRICPDLDTVCYTLAGLANPQTGWGRKEETFEVLRLVGELGGPTWFRLGDKDLATHLERTRRLREGQRLSQVVESFCSRWGITARVLPMSDDPVRTMVHTLEYGWLGFQDYFVRCACQPAVKEFAFEGIEKALPAPGVLEALERSDLIVIGIL
jgi:LPPG:FO 2-phospho-L-lactate transferase (EC 2.7.1.-)